MQVCASCYVVDFDNLELLMVYNKKLDKWLQPGGHIEQGESPIETAIREVKEETGIDIELIGNKFQGNIEPIAVENYETKIGLMLDIQYVGITKNKKIVDKENNNARWISIEELKNSNNIDEEIIEKFEFIIKYLKM